MAYELLALLTDDADITVDRLADLLRQDFASDPGAAIRIEDAAAQPIPSVAVRWDGWSFRLSVEDQPHVRAESEGIAEAFASGRPNRDLIASCRRRISVAADPDPDMDHFNDYLFIMERLGKLTGVILFDPKVPEFVEE